MSPRAKAISDDAVIAACIELLGHCGPAGPTFVELGEVTGLAPATLVQRFATKRALLHVVLARDAERVQPIFAQARAHAPTPLAALRSALILLLAPFSTAEQLSRYLAFLQLQRSDAECLPLLAARDKALRVQIGLLLAAAVEEGELAPCDRSGIVRTIQFGYHGALFCWALDGTGTVADAVDAVLDVALGDYS